MKEQIIELLSNGIPAHNVAAAVGCDPSYVSQIANDEDTAAVIRTKRMAKFTEHAEYDAKLDKAEQEALEKTKSLLAFVTKPTEAARVFTALNMARRRNEFNLPQGEMQGGTQDPSNPARVIVQLNIPQAAAIRFTLTSEKQVIDVEGRSLVTMPAKNLVQQLDARKTQAQLAMDVPTELFEPVKLRHSIVDKL